MDQILMIAGIGCRSGVSAEQVEAAIDAAICALRANEAASEPAHATSSSPARGRTLTAIATPAVKAQEPGIAAAAASRGVPLMLISQEALEAASAGTVTRSERSMAAMNVHSVAEAAALAGAFTAAGPKATATPGSNAPQPRTARLLASRITVGPVTCALADAGISP